MSSHVSSLQYPTDLQCYPRLFIFDLTWIRREFAEEKWNKFDFYDVFKRKKYSTNHIVWLRDWLRDWFRKKKWRYTRRRNVSLANQRQPFQSHLCVCHSLWHAMLMMMMMMCDWNGIGDVRETFKLIVFPNFFLNFWFFLFDDDDDDDDELGVTHNLAR